MPALGNIVTTLTQPRLLNKVVDNVLSGNVLLMRLLPKARTWSGGVKIDIPVNISAYTSLGSYYGS